MRFSTRLILGTMLGAVTTIATVALIAIALEQSIGLASPAGASIFLLSSWAGAALTLYGALTWARSTPSRVAARRRYASRLSDGRAPAHAVAAGAVVLPRH